MIKTIVTIDDLINETKEEIEQLKSEIKTLKGIEESYKVEIRVLKERLDAKR